MDGTKLGNLTLEFLERMRERFGDDAELGTFAIVADVNHVNEDGEDENSFSYLCSDKRGWVQVAFFSNVSEISVESSDRLTVDDD